jgi:hypothetical protein
MFNKSVLLFLPLFLLSLNIFAQKTDDDAVKLKLQKETRLLEQILADAKNLRLPENRAIVFSRVGGAYWKIDEKQARTLFQDAIVDLEKAQNEAANEKNGKQYFQALIYGQSPRLEIINLVAARDAELALEYFAKTRPPQITQALANFTDDNNSTIQQFARSEITTEQRLIGLAAEQNPQLAIKRVRDSLKKSVTYETLNLLKKIYVKDPETADNLAEEIAQNFLGADFSKNYQTLETVGYFVNDMGRQREPDEKSLKISDASLRSLVTKMTDYWLGLKNNQFSGYWNSVAVVERLFPDRAAKLKKKLEQVNTQNQNPETLEYNKLISGNTSPEELITQAEKFQSSYKNEIYRIAADKFAQNGNVAQAERIIQTNFSEEQADNYKSRFYANLSYQMAGQGKFDEANGYINQIPDENQRINALIYLANTIFQKNPKENQNQAERVLDQANTLISNPLETQTDLSFAVSLATAYAPININESFRLIESLMPMLNELVQANFVLMKFRSYGGCRQGEMQLSSGNNLGVDNLENVLRLLKEKDFDRTLQFTNGFARPEMRLIFQLQLVDQGLMNGSFLMRRSNFISID